jgi:hypothetical protein
MGNYLLAKSLLGSGMIARKFIVGNAFLTGDRCDLLSLPYINLL